MSTIVLDDHLLRDLLVDALPPPLAALLDEHRPATTNLYLYRLCRSALAAGGGRLTGALPAAARRALGRALIHEAADVEVVPMRQVALRMADLAAEHRLSTLGAEAVAAADHLGAALCVWAGDDGPAIRGAAAAAGVEYVAITR